MADGRDWILGTEKPSLADIEAVWPFHWLVGMKTALPAELVGPSTHPKVFAYVKRFDDAVRAAAKKMPKVTRLKGQDAIKHIT